MNLIRAFDVREKEVVAFVGGGGKTTAMFRLADELVAQDKRVVTTTTTRIFASQIQLAPHHIFAGEIKQTIRDTRSAIRNTPHLLVIGAKSDDGKAFGVDPTLVDQLIALDEVDVVLVEADGSRMRPFKAPAEHEPVIPQSTTLLVPVVGIDAVGKKLDDAHVHRAEIISHIVNLPLGAILKPEHIARVIVSPRGGLKNKPLKARVIPLINKVENDEQMSNARAITNELLKNDTIHSVALGAVRNLQATSFLAPISSLQSPISAILLAAGGSTRMQGNVKQLLSWGDVTLVRNAVNVAHASRVAEIVVVTGNRAAEIEKEIGETRANVRLAHNPDWATGRASSVRVGIGALSEKAAGAIFINADQPFLTPQVIDTILEKFFETRAPIVVPMYQGKTGSPVLFVRELFAELNALQGEQGGRDILQKYRDVLQKVEIKDARAAMDLDTPEEYERARGMKDESGRMKDEG